MSNHNDLARDIDTGAYAKTIVPDPRSETEAIKRQYTAEKIAGQLWAAGWRKKPEREAIARAIASGLDGWNDFDAASDDYKRELLEGADAVLALMDGPTEAGESK